MTEPSARLGLPFIQAAQAQKHVTHNEALERLDLAVQLSVQGFGAETPPEAPEDGQVWALGPAPTGAWAGQDHALAGWSNGGWIFFVPRPGWRAAQGSALRLWDGEAWVAPDLPDLHNLPGVGINASHDATNRLAVAAAATLLSHEGGGHRLMVNKAASAETASLLFQTAASGRAEMGTTGTDAFAIKASPDGAAWHTGFEMRPSDGRVTLPGGLKVQGSLALDGVAGTLGSLGGLAGTADTMPYWTGAGTMDATGLTGAARQLLASDRIGVAGNTLTTPANARLTGGVVQSSLTDTTTGRAMLVGAFGWGSGTSNINALTTENALDDLRGGRMDRVQTANVATVNGPPGAQGGTALTMSYSAGNVVQMYVEVVGAGRAWFRHLNAGTWSVYRQLLTSGNTTVDGNGFIKAASPIVRLFADRIEEPVQPTGAVLTRTGVGTYALAGTLGLAQDGWQIEVPRDHNGNRLCHVATRWARGVLTVTVTDPVWRNGTWVAGAPADVPEGRWIDIRLHEAPEAARNGEAGG